MLAGPYRIPNLEIVVSSVFTNRVPVTPYRGAGQPQAVFVIERVLDLVARATGRDPAAVRLANLVRPSEMPYVTTEEITVVLGDTGAIEDGIGTYARRGAAVASAIEDALTGGGVQIRRMPVTAIDLRSLLDGRVV
jgi:CO/xanthine dehydrogenase Mo-binding subunit